MSYSVAIKGFGRIGRAVLRALFERNLLGELKVVAVNDLAEPAAMAHLFKYDSTHGRLDAPMRLEGSTFYLGEHAIELLSEPEPEKLPLADVDLVIDCTGVIRHHLDAEAYLLAGAKKVLLSNPADEGVDATVVMGVNDHLYNAEKHAIVTAASCTTNCLAPVIKVLQDKIGIKHGSMTTIHDITNTQTILDAPHKDLRRARA